MIYFCLYLTRLVVLPNVSQTASWLFTISLYLPTEWSSTHEPWHIYTAVFHYERQKKSSHQSFILRITLLFADDLVRLTSLEWNLHHMLEQFAAQCEAARWESALPSMSPWYPAEKWQIGPSGLENYHLKRELSNISVSCWWSSHHRKVQQLLLI